MSMDRKGEKNALFALARKIPLLNEYFEAYGVKRLLLQSYVIPFDSPATTDAPTETPPRFGVYRRRAVIPEP